MLKMKTVFCLLLPVEDEVISLVIKARTSDQHVLHCTWSLHPRAEKTVTTGVGLGPESAEPVSLVSPTKALGNN